jgi:hypothetical protein
MRRDISKRRLAAVRFDAEQEDAADAPNVQLTMGRPARLGKEPARPAAPLGRCAKRRLSDNPPAHYGARTARTGTALGPCDKQSASLSGAKGSRVQW